MRDFSPSTRRALARKGIAVLSPVAIPDMASAMPWANADRGYAVDDNGMHRILSFAQVLEAAR
jgi:hypothetical protein